MIKDKRINKIHEYVLEHKSVSLDELVKVFNVSKNTIRRDVQELVEQGDIKKVYGGVAVNEDSRAKLESFSDRQVRNQAEKVMIAKAAAQYVEDGDIIFIDSGTTTNEMFDFLKTKHLSIITNSLDFIVRSLLYENLNIISFGGILERKTNSFGSLQNKELLQTYNINKAFMASTGISLTNGVTNASPLESELKQTVVKRSAEVFLLVDHDKFDKYGLKTYCSLNEIDYLITDTTPNKTYLEYSESNSIQLVVAK